MPTNDGLTEADHGGGLVAGPDRVLHRNRLQSVLGRRMTGRRMCGWIVVRPSVIRLSIIRLSIIRLSVIRLPILLPGATSPGRAGVSRIARRGCPRWHEPPAASRGLRLAPGASLMAP